MTDIKGKNQEISGAIQAFLSSDKKCMLVTGTDNFQKHKLVVAALGTLCKDKHILFRTNALQNLAADSFLGWTGLERVPKSGELVKLHNNYYEFDSMFNVGTTRRTSRVFDCAILYPAEAVLCRKGCQSLDDLFHQKQIQQIFLITCSDEYPYDYSMLAQHADCKLVVDLNN